MQGGGTHSPPQGAQQSQRHRLRAQAPWRPPQGNAGPCSVVLLVSAFAQCSSRFSDVQTSALVRHRDLGHTPRPGAQTGASRKLGLSHNIRAGSSHSPMINKQRPELNGPSGLSVLTSKGPGVWLTFPAWLLASALGGDCGHTLGAKGTEGDARSPQEGGVGVGARWVCRLPWSQFQGCVLLESREGPADVPF